LAPGTIAEAGNALGFGAMHVATKRITVLPPQPLFYRISLCHRPRLRPIPGVSMSFLRTASLSLVALATTLLLGGSLHAADVSMAGGSVQFHTPDDWVDILDTQGDPEVHVFQVPDSSPTGKISLSRVTVTAKQVGDISGFQQYVSTASAKSLALPGYKPAAVPPEPNTFVYTAQESGVPYNYSERYWFKNGIAIALRCLRPSQSEAGAAWKAAFDHGCDAIAAKLK
jgi:hypothetical protein